MSVNAKSCVRIACAAAVIVAGVLGLRLFGREEQPSYSVAKVQRGDIIKTISATGKLQAVVTVQVGSQVSGRVSEIFVDFNSRVRKGQVIARLDPALFQAQLEQAEANRANAQARVETAENAVANARASITSAAANQDRLQAAQQDADRAARHTNELIGTGAVSTREIEAAQATLSQANAQLQQAVAQVEQARAQLQSAQSQVNEARAMLKQNEAAVAMARTNLEFTAIHAPIDGVVISRSVDVGQTVAASLQAPILFLIANDLTRMQVLAAIDEADVGQLAKDSEVSFTVDAFPGEVFRGKISQIRLNAEAVQNVVTYTAVIDVRNPEAKLRPGMTANVTAVVARRTGVIKVPNAALRFRGNSSGKSGQQRVWKIADKGEVQPVPVTLGVNDGSHTEIVSAEVSPGDEVATGMDGDSAASKARPNNPMMPFGGGGGRRGVR